MKRADRVFLSGCAGLIGFVLFYTLPVYVRLPSTFYDPVARRWHVALPGALGPIPMGYLGQNIWGIAGALICAGIAAAASSLPGAHLSDRAHALFTAWTLTALGLVIAYFTWNNWP